MNILALDTGTVTGWAIRAEGQYFSGTADFSHDAKRESPGMRFLRFTKWLRELAHDHEVGLVIFEMAHHRGGAPTVVGVGLTTHLLSTCADLGIEHQSVHSGTLKKFATGKGNANKQEMGEALTRRWPDLCRPITDDNEVDALWLLAYAEDRL
jgi:Holliday junction resolvasome RuvABC endonuclease subunit